MDEIVFNKNAPRYETRNANRIRLPLTRKTE